jgi:regulator of sigma E protease
LNEAKTIRVKRNGEMIDLKVPAGSIRTLINRKGDPLARPAYPAVVDSILTSKAKFTQNELKHADTIIALNGQPITSYFQLQDKKSQMKNSDITLLVARPTGDTVEVKAKTDDVANIGFRPVYADKFLKIETRKYSFAEALPAGVAKGWETLVANIKNFKLLFTSKEVKASESLGSFISIGNMFGEQWDWERFWSMTALLSIVLAFMNILPIPALDGGHVIFTLYEMISGRKPSEKFMEYAQMVGMILLLLLMAYALGLDFWRFLFKS